MPLKNIECQLAQGQLNRYMGGDGLSDSALEQLEGHIRECEDCGIYLDEKKRALQAMIDPQVPSTSAPAKPQNIPTHAVVEFPEESKPANSFMATLVKKRAALDQAVRPASNSNTTAQSAAPTPSSFVKPLLYSLGLAAVLIGMSALMRDPTRLLGDRVEKTNPEAGKASPPEPKPNTVETESSATNKSDSVKPNNGAGSVPPTAESTTNSSTSQSASNEAANTKPDATKTNTAAASTPNQPTTNQPKNSIKAPATTRSTTRSTTRTAPRKAPAKGRVAARKPRVATNTVKPLSKGIKVYHGPGQLIADQGKETTHEAMDA